MSSIDPMTSKSKPFLPQVTNQSNMNKRPGVIQRTYCINPPYASHQLISPGLMTAMLTSLVSKYYKRLQPIFSRLLVMDGFTLSTLRARYKRIEENLCGQSYSSGDPPISKSTCIPEWEVNSVYTRKKYGSHNEGNFDIDD